MVAMVAMVALVGPGWPWLALVGPGGPWWPWLATVALVGHGGPWWTLVALVGHVGPGWPWLAVLAFCLFRYARAREHGLQNPSAGRVRSFGGGGCLTLLQRIPIVCRIACGPYYL